MASRLPIDDNSNTKSEEGTIAFHKKRARRVSFAENTSVHIFDRDEDSGTPSDPKPPNSPSNDLSSAERDNEPSQLFWNVEEDDNDNNNEDDDMDEPGSRSPFLRLVGSPSSGGSTIGSANSNDEDNFFGPVSSSFIRRDLLDSAGSDANHDQTMDSTAFSMHFRSIARSDSEVELKTSTGVHLSFEEKTPTQDSVPTNTGTSMLMTVAKKPNYQPSVSTSKLSTCSESNDMSIVGEYHYKYDYGELSPTLDALLAESNKDLHVISPSNGSILKSPRNSETTKEDGGNFMDFSHDEDKEGNITHEMVNEVVSLEHNGLGVANDASKRSPSKQIALGVSSYSSDAEISRSLLASSSILATPIAMTKDLVEDAFQIKSSLDFSATSQDRNPTVYLDDVTGKEHKSPFVGSVNSLTDKPSHMLLRGVSPSKSAPAVTPHNHSSVFVRTEIPKHGGSVASIQKSISKLRMLEASPFSAVLNAKLDDSTKKRSVVSPSKMTPLYTLLEKNDKALLLNYMNDSMQSSSAAQKKRERASLINMDNIGFETPKNGVPVTHIQNFVNVASPLLLPPESTWSKEMLQTDLLSSAEIRYGYKDNKSEVGLPQNFGSPQKKLKIVNASEFKSSPLRDAKQFIEHNESVKLGPGHVAGSAEKENVTNASLSTTPADRTDALYIETIEKSSPLICNGKEMVDSREVFLNDIRFNSEMKEKSTTLLKDVEREKFQHNFTGSEIARGEVKRASLALHEGTDKQSYQKNLHDQFCQSPPNKPPYNVLHDDNVDSLMEENVPSPSPHLLPIGDVISDRQTEAEDGMVEKTARTHRSPNPGKGYAGPELASDNEVSMIRHNLKHPTEINAMLSKEMSELLSQSVDKFSLHSIDHLAGIVEQLLRSKTYQLLSEEIQSQKSVDASKYIRHKRASEMKLLLCQFVHEKAKLQLLHVKRERLLRRVKSLVSGILESEVYRLNIPPQQSQGVHRESLSVNMKDLQESQSDSDKVTSMGQAIDHIDGRIATLTKSFHKSCKIKGEPSSTDTITLVNSYLMKQACCQMIRKDLQLSAVDSLESRNGCSNVVLNYLNLMTQRFTVSALPVPSISISHALNNINISKIFKDMDAFTAFRFVFNTEITQKHVGPTSLAQETQVTGSCLGNLLDVVTEIQLARIELKNLISTRFCTPLALAEQLELELCFFDSKHRRKATITLDTSCLRRGIYPSEIIPSQIDIAVEEPQSSASLKDEIASALQDLKVGYLRIQQLCRCISKLISCPIR
ncbi:hypothetical protein L6452_00617 [Arctium lappa]|uniref:Uncharacterized protein n=1 Tax=Arctium lappa TaxID=4217 RepID=A0ACB9FFP4_ARCLA|nr:hypothetical protein L6452_00617 [Arctium lappa]